MVDLICPELGVSEDNKVTAVVDESTTPRQNGPKLGPKNGKKNGPTNGPKKYSNGPRVRWSSPYFVLFPFTTLQGNENCSAYISVAQDMIISRCPPPPPSPSAPNSLEAVDTIGHDSMCIFFIIWSAPLSDATRNGSKMTE